MKKFSKVFAAVMAVALLVGCLTACSSKSDESATLNEGKIIFGTNAEFPPFEYVDTEKPVLDKQFAGIDMEIAKAVAEENKMTAEISNMEFDSLLLALENGQIDAVISGMTITEDRKKSVDFTEPYYIATQVMIVKKDSAIKTAADMKDKKIIVIQGYTGQTAVDALKEAAGGEGYAYEAFKKGTEGVMEVANGKADVLVIDSATADQYVKDNPDLIIVKDEKAFEAEEYGMAVKKGNTALLEILNKGIKALKDNGKIAEWSASYTSGQ